MSTSVINPFAKVERMRVLKHKREKEPRDRMEYIASIKRNLFGSASREENRTFLEKEMAAVKAQKKERWGFDFDQEKPIEHPNKLVWEKVVPKDCQVKTLRVQPAPTSSRLKPSTTTLVTDDQKPKLQQTKISEFMGKRKRPMEAPEIVKREKLQKESSSSTAASTQH